VNVEIENMELVRKQLDCKKFYKEINMSREEFKPRVHVCRNEDRSLTFKG